MFSYHFHRSLILRLPVYNYQFYTGSNLTQVLKNDFFQKAIYFASEAFYDELKKADFEFDKLDKKAVETASKYFNRMCFRPTPFGICSGVGVVNWHDSTSEIKLLTGNVQPHIRFSYAKSVAYARQILNSKWQTLIYKANSTLYKSGGDYRFLKHFDKGVQIDFIIDSLKPDRLFNRLITYLTPGRTIEELTEFIMHRGKCLADEANIYLQWLLDNQLISHQLDVNITGKDYLERVLDNGYDEPVQIIETINLLEKINSVEELKNIPEALEETVGGINNTDFYLNLKVAFPGGKLDSIYQKDILDGLNCLNHLSSSNQVPPGIAEFIENFNQKFDGQTVPLLAALDPETGVGYNNLAVVGDDSNIARNIMNGPVAAEQKSVKWNSVHAMLFKKWQTMPVDATSMVLTDDDLKQGSPASGNLASTMSVMFRIANGQVFIENAGGVCASALIGRLTPVDQAIHQLACSLAEKEITHNPDIIFAEVAHVCHSQTANIDRRLHIYPYEIPVLVQSTVDTDCQVLLSDLWVSVINGKVILQSKKHNKRVIPRLSSAFNYNRNDLAVFRFLCDLQWSEIKGVSNLSLSRFFPEMDFYPRVTYKNAILHLAYWNLKQALFHPVFKATGAEKNNLFNIIRLKLKLPRYVALTNNDHQLVFDLDVQADVLFFLDTIKNIQQVKLVEFLLPDDDRPIVKNEHNKPHINQFIAFLYHCEQIYQPFTLPLVSLKKTKRKFIPGGEWLYVKIYCHPVRSNELIGNTLFTTLKSLIIDEMLSQWFFIRYQDPGYHIRLRLKVRPQRLQDVLAILYKKIGHLVSEKIISDYNSNIYDREIERYSAELMDDFEFVFFTSSNLVGAFLHQVNAFEDVSHMLEFAIASVNDILLASGLGREQLILFLNQVSTSFFREFNVINDLKYQLDIEYRKQKSTIEQVINNQSAYYQKLRLGNQRRLFVNSLIEILKRINEVNAGRRQQWLADIIHMHLNRIFTNEPRKQEMTIYYFLLKHERSVLARNKTVK